MKKYREITFLEVKSRTPFCRHPGIMCDRFDHVHSLRSLSVQLPCTSDHMTRHNTHVT